MHQNPKNIAVLCGVELSRNKLVDYPYPGVRTVLSEQNTEIGMFYNHITRANEADAVEEKHGRWYIRCGFSGFNSPANNGWGYVSKARAEAAIRRYESK